jgi:hypothetical protein
LFKKISWFFSAYSNYSFSRLLFLLVQSFDHPIWMVYLLHTHAIHVMYFTALSVSIFRGKFPVPGSLVSYFTRTLR